MFEASARQKPDSIRGHPMLPQTTEKTRPGDIPEPCLVVGQALVLRYGRRYEETLSETDSQSAIDAILVIGVDRSHIYQLYITLAPKTRGSE